MQFYHVLTRQKRKPFTVVNRELAICPLENIWMNKQNLRSLEILYERHVKEPQEIICYVLYVAYEFYYYLYKPVVNLLLHFLS